VGKARVQWLVRVHSKETLTSIKGVEFLEWLSH
jgi:hypothetical protein